MPRPFAVFDIDGTLVRWQLYHAVVDKLAHGGHLGPQAQQRLHSARRDWKNRIHKESFREYELVLVNTYEAALKRLSVKAFDNMVEEVIEEYKDQVYTYTRELIKSLKDQGYFLLAISGSHLELVKAISEHYGFNDYVGSKYHRAGEHFSGQKFIASKNKKQVFEQLVTQHGLAHTGSIGIGDSKSDVAFLEEVEQPIAFNPDRALYDHARRAGWKIIIERKNVVYELEPTDGRYLLA